MNLKNGECKKKEESYLSWGKIAGCEEELITDNEITGDRLISPFFWNFNLRAGAEKMGPYYYCLNTECRHYRSLTPKKKKKKRVITLEHI